MANSFEEVLANFGTVLTAEGALICADLKKAHQPYIHHSFVPVAVTAFALMSPDYARDRFPAQRLSELVLKRSSMDRPAAIALAKICGQTISPDFDPNEFIEYLLVVLDRYHTLPLFTRVPTKPAMWGIDVRPRGVALETTDWETKERKMDLWRSAYAGLTTADQILVATIMWLYRGQVDNDWMSGLPNDWPAVDAICTLKEAGLLGKWSKLVATYPGW